MTIGIDESVQILLDGFRFNASSDSDPDGCYWPAVMAGWSSRQTKTQRTPKPVLPGSYRAPNPTAEKIISLTGWCVAESAVQRSRAENRLQAICPDPEITYRMDVTEEDGTRYRFVELENVDIRRFEELTFQFTIQLAAQDPMKYDTGLLSASVGLPSGGSLGLDWANPTGLDWADPTGLDWGVSGANGVMSLANSGKAPAWPTFTIAAGANALVNPVITEQSTGRQLRYTGTLAAGETLVIDTNPFARTVLLGGVADRRPFLTRAEWFPIPANGSTAAVFTADVFSATALLTAEWHNTYF